jgi:hypothetical protein
MVAMRLGTSDDGDQVAERPFADEVVLPRNTQRDDHAGRSPFDLAHDLRLDWRILVREVNQHHVFDQKPLNLHIKRHKVSVCARAEQVMAERQSDQS